MGPADFGSLNFRKPGSRAVIPGAPNMMSPKSGALDLMLPDLGALSNEHEVGRGSEGA